MTKSKGEASLHCESLADAIQRGREVSENQQKFIAAAKRTGRLIGAHWCHRRGFRLRQIVGAVAANS